LTPVDGETSKLCREQAAIFLRWRQSFDEGKVELSTDTSLPHGRARYRDLETIIATALAPNQHQRFKAFGTMKRMEKPRNLAMSHFEVAWTAVE
jgi:hypothetical protein